MTGDGGVGVFLVVQLTKFLAGWGFIVTRWGIVRQPVTCLEPVYTQESFWPQERCVVTRRRVTLHILFKHQMSNYELFVFLLTLGAVLWALISEESKCLFEKQVLGPHVNVRSLV
jgi:hypothetical protein